jgi:hypothetical protein
LGSIGEQAPWDYIGKLIIERRKSKATIKAKKGEDLTG